MTIPPLLRLMTTIAILLLVGCANPPYDEVDAAELQALLDRGVPLYDVRRPEEWRQTGVIAGSQKLTWVDGSGRPTREFYTTFLRDVPKDQPVAVICRTGNRTAHLARELMERHGYTQVHNVTHGIKGWLAKGLPVVKD